MMRSRQVNILLAALFPALFAHLGQAARSCVQTNTPTSFKWTVSEFTYDFPDKTARGRAATDAVVGLYLTDYSCYGAWPEAWSGRIPSSGFGSSTPGAATTVNSSSSQPSSSGPLIWFPCINSRGRAVDETVSFAVDWEASELHVAHMYLCSDGPNQGRPTTASTTQPLTTICNTVQPPRCITNDRFFDVTTSPDAINPPLVSPSPCSTTASSSPSWGITDYAPLYYAFRSSTSPPAITTPDDILFSVQSITDTTNTTYDCTEFAQPRLIPRRRRRRRQAGAGSGRAIISGVCRSDVTERVVTFQFDPVYKILKVEQQGTGACVAAGSGGGGGEGLTLKGAGALPESACGGPGCELDKFWIGGEVE